MPTYVLRVEGVDFGATIEDTHNLSAYRGGSLALLAAPIAVGKILKVTKALNKTIFEAASLGAWIIEAKDDAAAEKLRSNVREFLRGNLAVFASASKAVSDALAPMVSAEAAWPHLSFVVDLAPVKPAVAGADTEYLALKQAEANNYARQFREANWSVPAFDSDARGGSVGWDEKDKKWKPVHLDPVRPAKVERGIKKQRVKVSLSFATRFDRGKKARQNIYRVEADDGKADGLYFTNSFEEIIGNPPEGLPSSVSGKIAVFYADGNSFTKIREKSATCADYGAFSARVLDKQRGLMGSILAWLKAGATYKKRKSEFVFEDPEEEEEDYREKARFETLRWGADEIIFVMPAWLGIEFAQKFFDEWTNGWIAPSGESLTFGAGLLFCHEKTPIRQARKMAKIMAEDAKKTLDGALQHVLQIEAFESIAMPEWGEGLRRYRAKLFDLGESFDEKTLAEALTLRGDEISKTFGSVKDMKNGGFPRSQLYWLLRKARGKKLFASLTDKLSADEILTREARAYFGRKNLNADEHLPKLNILAGAPLAYSLAAAAALWDYVDPLETAK